MVFNAQSQSLLRVQLKVQTSSISYTLAFSLQ